MTEVAGQLSESVVQALPTLAGGLRGRRREIANLGSKTRGFNALFWLVLTSRLTRLYPVSPVVSPVQNLFNLICNPFFGQV